MSMACRPPAGVAPAGPLPACLCGGAAYRPIRRPEPFGADGPVFAVVRCERCGLARTDPPPFEDDRSAAIHQELPFEAVATREAEWRRFFAPLLDAAWRHRPGGRFLDVGCGAGLTVKMAAERGYDAHGVEINARSAAYARDVLGLAVVHADLAGAGFAPASFDVVLLSHVLEHLSDPAAVFADIRSVLRPDGIVVVEVPNMAGLVVPLLGRRWPGWAPYMHVWQFTPATLVDALGRVGFAAVEVRARDNMEFGTPRGMLKRAVRATAFRAAERLAAALNRSDKVLCVARPAAGVAGAGRR